MLTLKYEICVTFQPPLIVRGGGFGELRRRRKGLFKFKLTLYKTPQSASLTAPPEEEPIITFAASVYLRRIAPKSEGLI